MLPVILLIASIVSLAFMLAVAVRRKTFGMNTQQHELIHLFCRYRFFQGKNLETFSRLVSANNFNGIEQMVREKFATQGKANPTILAQQLLQKLSSEFGR